MATKVQKIVRFFYLGSLVSNYQDKKVDDYYEVSVPKNAFAYQFLERTILETQTEVLKGELKIASKMKYPEGQVMGIKEVQESSDLEILISNMKYNNWESVVKTRLGNFQPFNEESDEIVSSTR